MNLACRFGFHRWHYRLSEVGYVPLKGWPLGTSCIRCGIPHPQPLDPPHSCPRHLWPGPQEIAECGGPCEDYGPQACDCRPSESP